MQGYSFLYEGLVMPEKKKVREYKSAETRGVVKKLDQIEKTLGKILTALKKQKS